MKLAAKLVVHRDDGAIDVADQAVAENDVGDFPVAPSPRIRQRLKTGDLSRFAAGLAAQRLVRKRRQLRPVLSNGHAAPDIALTPVAAAGRDALR